MSVKKIDEAIKAQVIAAARQIDNQKGADIEILAVADVSTLADYFLIATGFSRPHIRALVESVDQVVKDMGRTRIGKEEPYSAEWVLCDYGDFVIHIFQEDARNLYNLEGIWGDAPRLEWR